MKTKLIKTDSDSHHNGHYFLNNEEGFAIGSTDYEWCRRVASVKPQYKLSKENCDEIFGVVSPEVMMKDIESNCDKTKEGYILGFQMAMELNKDKVFTLEDMRNAIELAQGGSMQEVHNGYGRSTELEFVLDNLSTDEIIQSIQQPTEIEVEIITVPTLSNSGNVYFGDIPKLDENGCLILKQIEN
jgi:hypothetical protein